MTEQLPQQVRHELRLEVYKGDEQCNVICLKCKNPLLAYEIKRDEAGKVSGIETMLPLCIEPCSRQGLKSFRRKQQEIQESQMAQGVPTEYSWKCSHCGWLHVFAWQNLEKEIIDYANQATRTP